MCYSRYWEAEQAREQQEMREKAKEAEAKRSGTINSLLSDAGKQAQKAAPAKAPARETAPAK